MSQNRQKLGLQYKLSADQEMLKAFMTSWWPNINFSQLL